MVIAEFDITIKVKILGKKCAYLLSCLLKGIMNLGEEHGIEPVIPHSSTLRKHLETNFPAVLGFFPSSKQVIVYSSEMTPYRMHWRGATIIAACVCTSRRSMH